MGETVLQLVVRAKDFTRRTLKRTERGLRGFAARTRQRFQRVRSAVFSVRGALTALAGAGAITALAKKTFDLGAEIEETTSKYRTVFGPAVDRVNRQMEEQARVMGLTDNEFRSLAATSGDIVQGFGASESEAANLSSTMLKLAADMTSFNNVPMEETTRAVQAALTGEREQLKRLGVVIRETDVQERALLQTGKERAEQLTQLEKAEATVALIRERMSKALGDLDRTADSNANTARRLAAEWKQFRNVLAQAAMPVLSDLLGQVDDQTSRLESWSEAIQNNQEVINAWARVTLESIKFVAQSVATLVRTAFNMGQAVGNLIQIVISNAIGHVLRLANRAVEALNSIIEGANKIPGVDIDFRFAGFDAERFLEFSQEEFERLKGNIMDGVDSVGNLIQRWKATRDAAREAAFAQERAAAAADRADEGGTGGGGGGGGGGEVVEPFGLGESPGAGLVGPTTEAADGADKLAGGMDLITEKTSKAEKAIASFGTEASKAFSGALAGAILASEGMRKGFLGNLAKMAVGKGQFYLAEAAAALATGILGDPKGFAAAKQYTVAAGMMFGLAATLGGAAAAVSGGSGGGGGGGAAGGAAGRADRQVSQSGRASKPPARIVVEGGLLDVNDPRQARQLAAAIENVSDRDVIVEEA